MGGKTDNFKGLGTQVSMSKDFALELANCLPIPPTGGPAPAATLPPNAPSAETPIRRLALVLLLRHYPLSLQT